VAQAGLGKKRDPISKITREKRPRVMAQVVEHLPSKCQALSSNPSIAKKKKKKKKREEIEHFQRSE
jgi:hypothetical protein